MTKLFIGPLLAWARKLRYPTLFKLTAALFVVTLVLPDPIPFLDEIVLGLGTLLLANWHQRKRPVAQGGAAPASPHPPGSGAASPRPPIDLPPIR